MTTEIILLQSDINYTHVFLRDGTKLIEARTLKSFEQELAGGEPLGGVPHNQQFIRPNKSHIVNLEYFLRIDEDSFMCLSNGVRVKIARRRKAAIIKILNELNF